MNISSKLYLASASPNRKKLLEQIIGKNFEIVVSDYEEEFIDTMSPTDLVQHLATEKALSVCKTLNDGIIIAADTIVVHNASIFGKPHTEERAASYLRQIKGQQIEVISGLAVVKLPENKRYCEALTTKVFMANYTEHEIKNYVATKEPLDKAGGFAIQGLGSVFVEKIEGDYYNIVGLPLQRLYTIFRDIGLDIIRK